MKDKKYVEKIRYEGFESEEEARKFLEESERFFNETFRRMWEWHRSMMESFNRLFEPLWEPVIEKPKSWRPVDVADDVYGRLERLEKDVDDIKKDMKDVKELLLKKYIKKKKEMVV